MGHTVPPAAWIIGLAALIAGCHHGRSAASDPSPPAGEIAGEVEEAVVTPAGGVYRLALGALPAGGVKVRLEKIRFTRESFEVPAFLNLPEDRVESAGTSDSHYADTYFMYGSGDPPEAEERETYLNGVLRLSPELIRQHGRPGDNELVLIVQDAAARPIGKPLLQFANYSVEPISRRR